MPKFFVSLLILCVFIFTGFQTISPNNEIFQGLKNNDSKRIIKYFDSTVNLSLKEESRICTKFQSELILSGFFEANRIESVKVVSTGANKSNNPYVVYEVTTAKGNHKVLVKFMEIKGEVSVVEFVIH